MLQTEHALGKEVYGERHGHARETMKERQRATAVTTTYLVA